MLGVLSWFAGAKRWFNAEAAKALAAALIVIVLAIGAASLFAAGEGAGGAKTQAVWLSKFNAWNVMQAQRRARMASRALEREARARAEAERERDEAVARAAVHAAQLATLKASGKDRVIITHEERMRYFSQ